MVTATKEDQKTQKGASSDREDVRSQLQRAFPDLKEEMDRVQNDRDEAERACYGTR